MKKKLLSVVLVSAMLAGTLAGCGSSGSAPADNGGNADADSGVQSGDAASAQTDEGQVINIYSFNDELRNRITAVYSEIENTSDDGTESTLKDGTVIHWIINPNQDGVYQDKLDEAIGAQASASADDKVDIFAAELDYIVKYTDADINVAMPLESLGN